MLAYILAIVVFLGSLAFYLAPFFYPEIHRKGDFYLSGLGLFYALVLWVCAGRITGSVLLGQIAGVSLVGWFALETAFMRRSLTQPQEQTEISPQVQEKIGNLLQTGWVAALVAPVIGLFRPSESQPTYSQTEQTAVSQATPEPAVESPTQQATEPVPSTAEESIFSQTGTIAATAAASAAAAIAANEVIESLDQVPLETPTTEEQATPSTPDLGFLNEEPSLETPTEEQTAPSTPDLGFLNEEPSL
nr:Ycf66 family protein [Prochloraceae cyanobacterium]